MKLLMAVTLFITTLFISVSVQAQEIFEAAKSGDLLKITKIIEESPNLINAKDLIGRTPLHWAARGVHYNILKFLIENGAEVNEKDSNKVTSLLSVVSRGHYEAAKLLIDHGAKLEEEDNYNKAPILYASYGESIAILDMLIKKGANLEVKDDYDRTPLLLVCRESGSLEKAKLLVENGAKINVKDKYGDTPLMLAAWRGYEQIVNYLLDKNAEFSVSENTAIELFQYAADKKLWKLYQALLNKGGSLFLQTISGYPILHWAAAGGSSKILTDLLNKNIAYNEKDIYGWTPLHYAAYFGRIDAVKLLIERGANVNSKTPLGETPLTLAEAEERKDMLRLLLSAGGITETGDLTELTGEYLGQKKLIDSTELFAPGIVSRLKCGHSNIVFSPNNEIAVWTEWNLKDSGYSDGSKLWYSKLINNYWTKPKKILSKGDTPFFSHDGKRLYVLAELPAPTDTNLIMGIWYYELEKNFLEGPKLLNFDVTGTGLYWQFSFNKKGDIYFSGSEGIFRSRLIKGEYQTKEKLSDIFHPDYKGMQPFISPDDDYIIFSSSNLPGSFGSGDLYIGYKNPDGTWTKPINMGSGINTPYNEMLPVVSSDNKYIFIRTEINGITGIYWVSAKIIEDLKPKNKGI